MDFGYDLSFLDCDDETDICAWTGDDFKTKLSPECIVKFCEIVDGLGNASCEAQGLNKPVTASYLLQTSKHILFIICDKERRRAIGILKVGHKKLFIHNLYREYEELCPLCVLDFYVNEKYQRMGIGLRLFEHMLKSQQALPHKLAYDRPSNKLLKFLSKHYQLSIFVPQNCNFVIFDEYFNKDCKIKHALTIKSKEAIVIKEPTVKLTDDPIIETKMKQHKQTRIEDMKYGHNMFSRLHFKNKHSNNQDLDRTLIEKQMRFKRQRLGFNN